MTAIRGSAAAVTGAASGIGRALALELAARGCDIALADRDEAGLQTVAAEINRTHSRKVTAHRVDVSEPQQIADFAQAATSAHPGLNIVVNNAGVALLGQFNEIDQAQMDWLMNINFWGVVHATRAFRRCHQYRAQLPRRHRRRRQCAPRAIDRAFRCHRKNHASRRRAAHYSGHREQPAADIDW